MPMLYTHDFENKILYEPALLNGEACTRLRIVTGFTDCDMIAQHLLNLHDGQKRNNNIYTKGIHIDIILGMYKGSGLTKRKHQKIKQTLTRINSIQKNGVQTSCRYIFRGAEVHSKIYIWCRNDGPVFGFAGSANYTMNAFRVRREVMTDCSPDEASRYYRSAYNDTIDCFDPHVSDYLKFKDKAEPDEEISAYNIENLTYFELIKKRPIDTLTVSWLTADGTIGLGSGPNWGIRGKEGYYDQHGIYHKYNRDRNQAYIPYNKKQQKAGFFPDRKSPEDKNCPMFKAVTKDDGIFYMRMAQDHNKAIECAESNAILGRWLRKKLHVPSGAEVTLDDFKRYGSYNVTFLKYADDVFIMEF